MKAHSEAERRNLLTITNLFQHALNGDRLDLLPELYAAHVLDHHAFPGAPAGLAGVIHSITEIQNAYPDAHHAIERLDPDGDLVRATVRFTGTRTGRLLLLPATGRRVDQTQELLFRLHEGRIVERWLIRRRNIKLKHRHTPQEEEISTDTSPNAAPQSHRVARASERRDREPPQ